MMETTKWNLPTERERTELYLCVFYTSIDHRGISSTPSLCWVWSHVWQPWQVPRHTQHTAQSSAKKWLCCVHITTKLPNMFNIQPSNHCRTKQTNLSQQDKMGHAGMLCTCMLGSVICTLKLHLSLICLFWLRSISTTSSPSRVLESPGVRLPSGAAT